MNLVTAYSLRWKDSHGMLSSGGSPAAPVCCRLPWDRHFRRALHATAFSSSVRKVPAQALVLTWSGVGEQGQRIFAFYSTWCDMKKIFLLPKTCIF